MSMQGRISRTGGTKVKRALGVQAALEWAFRVERVQLELPLPKDVSEEGFGFGMEYVLLQRGALGCKVGRFSLFVIAPGGIAATLIAVFLAAGAAHRPQTVSKHRHCLGPGRLSKLTDL
jgi:hypothetical protein